MLNIILTTYNRPKALRRTLESLARTDIDGLPFESISLHLDDDGSEDPGTLDVLEDIQRIPGSWGFDFPWVVHVWGKFEGHLGPNRRRRLSLWRCFDFHQRDERLDFVIASESDTIYHPSWLKTLLAFLSSCDRGSDGRVTKDGKTIATISPYRSRAYRSGEVVHAVGSTGWVERVWTGGVCHLIPWWWYERGKASRGWMAWDQIRDWRDIMWGRPDRTARTPIWGEHTGGWDYMMGDQAKREGLVFACLVPSLVDHVSGPEGGTSGSRLAGDRALDFIGEG